MQVTSDTSTTKINHTVKEYVNNDYNNKYKELKIVVLGFDPKRTKSDYSHNGFSFRRENIHYFNELLELIKNCSNEKIFTKETIILSFRKRFYLQ